jgi:hypothetical protein
MSAMTDSAYITVVSGLPRSGTSLMMQMLAAGGLPILSDGTRGPDADNPRGYFELEAAKKTRQDPSWLAAAPGKAVKVVHLPLHDLPAGYTYRVLFMKRRLEEVLASQRAMLDRLGKKGASLPDAELGRVYQGQLDRLEQWLPGQANFSVLYLSYNDLVAEPAPICDRINQFLDGRLDAVAMQKAVDPSLYRRRG